MNNDPAIGSKDIQEYCEEKFVKKPHCSMCDANEWWVKASNDDEGDMYGLNIFRRGCIAVPKSQLFFRIICNNCGYAVLINATSIFNWKLAKQEAKDE